MHQLFRAILRAASVAATLTVLAPAALAQAAEPVTTELIAPLPAVGRVETLSGTKLLKLFPLEDGVFIQNLEFPGDSGFRVHFSVLSPPEDQPLPAGSWSVKILNFADDGVRWSYTPEPAVRSFWSPVIRGSRARAIIVADASVAGRLQVLIDKVAHMQAITIPQTELNGKLVPIGQAPAAIKQAGRSVALLIVGRDGDEPPVPCTGFLVGRDLLMTNRHCIRSGSEARNTDVQFDIDRDGAEPSVQVRVKELVLTSCDLDFVLLRLDIPFGCASAACSSPNERMPLALARALTLVRGLTKLVAIQHPDGEPKQVALDGCIADQLGMVGSSSTTTDFGHKCATKGGSSGTPILLISDSGAVGAVVGLHHIGPRIDNVTEKEAKQVNRAVSIKEIIAYITQLKPALLGELTIK